MRLKCVGLTDTGMLRDHNEDCFLISEDEAFVIVADGMGGHLSGEVASSMALSAVHDFYAQTRDQKEPIELEPWPYGKKKPRSREERRLIASLIKSNELIHKSSQEDERYKGMGTTVVGGFFVQEGVIIAHVGDSRCYRFREGALAQITEDHSLANEYIRAKIIKPEQLESFLHKNVITRAVGLIDTVDVETNFLKHQDGDIYLFCSDGLTDPLTEQDIEDVLIKYSDDLKDACRELVIAANTNGGPDNITVLLVKVSD